MRLEKSCGAVVFTRCGEEIQYVIIRSVGGDYGFPKGHMESGETELETALREIREEVGIVPTIIDGFRMEVRYPLLRKPGVTKHVVFFLAEYAGQELCPQQSELSGAALMSYADALGVLPYAETANILTEADRFLRQSDSHR